MSDIFAEATVRISPSLTGFITQLREDLAEVMKKVNANPPVVRVAPGLQKGFIGNLRTQVNDAVTRVQGQVKPVRINVVLDLPSRRALAELAQAPVVVGGVAGHVPPPTGPAGGVSAGENARIKSLEAMGGQLLGLKKLEDEVGKARESGARKTKVAETAEARLLRIRKGVEAIEKSLADRILTAATATGGATGEARKDLALMIDLEKQALALRKEAPSALLAETAALHERTKVERTAAFDRLETLKQEAAAAKTARTTPAAGGTTKVQRDAIAAARKSADATKAVVAGLHATDAASKLLGNTTKDLSARKSLLTKQERLLERATAQVTATQTSQNAVVRAAALNAQRLAEAQVSASRTQLAALQQAKSLETQTAAARTAAARAAAREASAERRRSEQLSRGGQASLLSLAGIRGATLAASRSFLVGAAAITVFARAVKQFADLERNIHVFEATTAATEEQMEAVREEARLLGADLTLPSVTAGDAAGAMVELAKAGLTVQDSIDGARAVLELATAAAIDNADAVRLTANVLNAFSLTGKDAAAVADTLANAANAAQGSIADIGTAFQQAASAGHQVGLSFQDTATFLTILAKNGIRGSDAGTSLRTALIRLVNPSKDAKKAFEELGIQLRDAQGNIRPDVFLQIAEATAKLGPAQRDATIALIGGQDAFRAVTILGRQSIESFLAMREALRRQGTAAELAEARTRGLHGAIDGLQSVLETVGTTAAGHVGPAIANMVHHISAGVTALSENDQVATGLNQTLRAMGETFGALGTALQGVAAVAFPLANALAQVATSIGIGTILAGVVAWKTFNAVMDGAILRLRILKPLFATIAAARISASIATGFTEASIALAQFNKAANGLDAAGRVIATPVTGFARLTQVQRELAVSTALAAERMSTFRAATSGIKAGLLSLITPTNAALAAVTALGAGIFILATRESAAEKATKIFKSAIDELSTATSAAATTLDSYNQSLRTISSSRQAVETAKQALATRKVALATTDAIEGTAEYTSLLNAVAIARQDVKFAEEDYAKAVKDSGVQSEIAGQAQRNLQEARDRSAKSITLLTELTRREFDNEEIGQLRLVKALRDRAKAARETNTAESLFLAKRLEALEKITAELGTPSQQTIELLIATPNLRSALAGVAREFGNTAPEAVQAFVDSWIATLTGSGAAKIQAHWESVIKGVTKFFPSVNEQAEKSGTEAGDNWMAAAAAAARRRQRELEDALTAAFAAAQRKSSFAQAQLDVEANLAVIESGATGSTLGVEQDRLAQARADRATAERRIAQLRASGRETGLDTAAKARADAIAREAAAIEAIRGINDQLDSDAEAAAKEAEEKQDKRFENILKAMGLRRERQQQRIEDAKLSETLADDIKQTQILRQVAAKQIANLKKRIDAARKQGKNVEVLVEGLSDLREKWRDLGREIVKLNQEQNEALRDILFERFELRIQIAQSRQDVAAEIRIRRQKLEALTKELIRMRKQFGKNSIEWLRAKAAQAEEVAAIKELEKQVNEKNNAFAELSFAFLTTQQGFAANLLGNLLPSAAIGGTVAANLAGKSGGSGGIGGGGGGSSLAGAASFGGGLAAAAIAARGGDVGGLGSRTAIASVTEAGPTRGQATVELDLLRQIRDLLRLINGNKKFKEAKQAKVTGGSAMDVM